MLELGAIIVLYFSIALAFGLIYYGAFRVRTEVFIVHLEMNLRPTRFARLWKRASTAGTERPEPDPKPEGLEALYSEYLELHQKREAAFREQQGIETRLEDARARHAELGSKHNAEAARNEQEFNQRQERERAERVKQILSEMGAGLAEANDDAASARIAAEADAKLAGAFSPAKDKPTFTATSVLPALDAASAEVDGLVARGFELSKTIQTLQTNQENIIDKWDEARRRRLNLFDFLYFSMGVSTANTFGDIIPNDRLIRALITGQLLISVVLVGLFIDAVAS